MRRKQAAGLGGLVVALLLALLARWDGAAAPGPVEGSGPGFRSHARLVEHHDKHRRGFGDITVEQYLKRAQALRDRPAGGAVLEARRGDGVLTRFDRASGEFGAYDRDGTIRTFFRPSDGEAYFRRQLAREGERR